MRLVVALALTTVLGTPLSIFAQSEFGIVDNSFLVEEAFNQEPGIFQNIATYRWQRGQWLGSFTQEWPFPNMTHQLSFTVPFGRVTNAASLGDVMVNYRLQMLKESGSRPAFAPRVSVIIPSGSVEKEMSAGVVGWQLNLPFSKRSGDWYFHWNGGVTFLPGDKDVYGEQAQALVSPSVAGSVIWQASPTLNFLLEVTGESTAVAGTNGAAERTPQFTVSPGLRHAWNPGKSQVVVGLAAPITHVESSVRGGVFAYFSYELPFK